MERALDFFGYGGLPMDLDPGAMPVGWDDAGMPMFRGNTGQIYTVGQGKPNSGIMDGISAPMNALSGNAVTLGDAWNAAGMANNGSFGWGR